MRLTTIERKWLAALCDGFAPPTDSGVTADGEGLAPRPGEVDCIAGFERLNGSASPLAQVGLRFAVLLLGSAPVWARRQLRGMDALPVEERTALLEDLAQHRLTLVRELTWLLKVQASMSLFGHPSIRKRSRYDEGREEGTPVRLKALARGKLVEVA